MQRGPITGLAIAGTLAASLIASGCGGGGMPSGTKSPAANPLVATGGSSGSGVSTSTSTSTSAGTSTGTSSGSSALDPAVTEPEKIWHVDFESFGAQFFDNMVGHGVGVKSAGQAARVNVLAKEKLVGAVLARVNTAYLRSANGQKKPGQSFKVTFTASKPSGARFQGGAGVDYSRICIGSRDSQCAVGTVGVETMDYGNQIVDSACQINALGTFAGRICGRNSVLDAQSSTGPLTAADEKFLNGTYRLGQGSAADDDRFRAVNEVINDWGTSIGNVLAHEIGHAVGLVHDNNGSNIMMPVTNPTDLSNANLAFSAVSRQTLTQTLGVQP